MAETGARYYTWENGSRRYRNATSGRFVSRAAVRASLDSVIDVQMDRVRALSADLLNGSVTLADWRSEMSGALKVSHLEGAAVARGGWQQLGVQDYQFVQGRIRSELTYLQALHDDIAYGVQPLDGRVAARAAMYVAAGRSTERQVEHQMGLERGDDEERNILGPSVATCEECADLSDLGWVEAGTLPEVGDRTCMANCNCWIETRPARDVSP